MSPVDWMDSGEWLSLSDRDKFFFVSGYMTASHTWFMVLDHAPHAEWPQFKLSLSGPVWYNLEFIVDFMDQYYEAGGNLPFSVRVLELSK